MNMTASYSFQETFDTTTLEVVPFVEAFCGHGNDHLRGYVELSLE